MTKGVSIPSFTSIGIDIGKEVFHIVGFDDAGKMVLRKKIKRAALEQEFAKLPPSIVGMEACLTHILSVARSADWGTCPASFRRSM